MKTQFIYDLINLHPKWTGNIEDPQVVFKWILEQKADESIELIDRDTLNQYINTKDFLAVVFCK